MKRIITLIGLLVFIIPAFAQETVENYKFTDVIRLKATSVKDQAYTGTCWAFSAISFLESEMMRQGMNLEDVPNLSEMFVVRKVYEAKAEKYLRMHGTINFAGGGAFFDVLWTLKNFGMVPEEAYSGLIDGKTEHNHGELDKKLKEYVELMENKKKLPSDWGIGFNEILDKYLGEAPEKFTYKGKEYNPRTFADEVVKLNPDDYVSITSFTHHPYWTKFAIEIPDNWQWKESYNVPFEDLVIIADYALKNGYTVGWGTDNSEVYFSGKQGIAVVPNLPEPVVSDNKASGKTNNTPRNPFLTKPEPEIEITAEMRQTAYDDYETTDDHGMHIIGIAKDQNGKEYYIVKNSWGESNLYGGYIYVSKAYYEYKTINILVHKNAIPADIKKKMGL